MNPNDDAVTKQPESIPHEDIALRAYLFWEERGSPIGSPEEDWLRAEQEIRSENARPAKAAKSPRATAKAASA
jgi:hypothetical protein